MGSSEAGGLKQKMRRRHLKQGRGGAEPRCKEAVAEPAPSHPRPHPQAAGHTPRPQASLPEGPGLSQSCFHSTLEKDPALLRPKPGVELRSSDRGQGDWSGRHPTSGTLRAHPLCPGQGSKSKGLFISTSLDPSEIKSALLFSTERLRV